MFYFPYRTTGNDDDSSRYISSSEDEHKVSNESIPGEKPENEKFPKITSSLFDGLKISGSSSSAKASAPAIDEEASLIVEPLLMAPDDTKKDNEIEDNADSSSSWISKKLLLPVLMLSFALVFCVVGFNVNGYSNRAVDEDKVLAKLKMLSNMSNGLWVGDSDTKILDPLQDMRVIAENEYGYFEAPYTWLLDDAGSQLIEPFKETTLTLTGVAVSPDGYYINWNIPGLSDIFEFGAPMQKLTLTRPGKYILTVQAITPDGKVDYTMSMSLYCKYVKREIRTLTYEDREKFLDTAIQLWQYSQEEGEAKFGSQFTSIQTLVATHALSSNDVMCDQFHEGTGFFTHHFAFGNVFEASIRAIDPSVTVPYWDFTIEGQQIYSLGEKPSYLRKLTPIFSDEWFGDVDEQGHIINSRWAHSLMPRQEDTDSRVRNSYGYIRSYWNNNPDPEITRHMFDICGIEDVLKPIPTCKSHFDVLNSDSLGTFQVLSPADGHGTLHVQMGGVMGGCVDAYRNFTERWSHIVDVDMTAQEIKEIYGAKSWKWGYEKPVRNMLEQAIVGEYFHIYRYFWRSHMCAVDGSPMLLKCPDECDADVPFEECKCQVDALINGNTTWQNLLPCVLNSEENLNFFNLAMPEEMIEDLVTTLATASTMEGDMIESSSTADIMFWMIHPAIERLLSAKRLPKVTKMGKTEFSKWEDVDGSEERWVQFSVYDLNKNDSPFHPDEYTCYGHAKGDRVLPNPLPMTEDFADRDGDGEISNWEYYIALDPNDPDANDYVYDHFRWDHCDPLV